MDRTLTWLRRGMLALNRLVMLPWFRRSGGPGRSTLGGRVCVLRTIGRRSGLLREAPLSYAPTEGGIWVAAGFGSQTAWMHNLRANPLAEVQLGRQVLPVEAEELTRPDERTLAIRAVMVHAGAAGFCYGFDPRRASDERIRAATADVAVFRLRFIERFRAAA
jgi:deazaflavin-dependent oxidoreductase (nitroreductase family)